MYYLELMKSLKVINYPVYLNLQFEYDIQDKLVNIVVHMYQEDKFVHIFYRGNQLSSNIHQLFHYTLHHEYIHIFAYTVNHKNQEDNLVDNVHRNTQLDIYMSRCQDDILHYFYIYTHVDNLYQNIQLDICLCNWDLAILVDNNKLHELDHIAYYYFSNDNHIYVDNPHPNVLLDMCLHIVVHTFLLDNYIDLFHDDMVDQMDKNTVCSIESQ